VDRFAFEMLSAIDGLSERADSVTQGLEFCVAVPPGKAPSKRFAKIQTKEVGTRKGQLWEQMDLPKAVGENFLVNLCNTGPLLRRRQLTVIHDAATVRVPESYSRSFRTWYGFLIPSLYRRSHAVCTVSEFSRGELNAIYGERNDICVLPEGTEHMDRVSADPGVLARQGLLDRPFVLAVSSLSPHKNFSAVVEAVALLGDSGFDVAIAGGQNPKVFAAGDLPPSVKYVGYVTDEELKALYEHASCFVFPSIYEGYGLPPTEAMACGCPVLAARAASIPEVCRDAAEYFDPRSPVELADLLSRVMADQHLRQRMSNKGRERARDLRWEDAARILVKEVRRACA
jgi:glycosyltransferase involved in cell wall biosynthesis